MKKGLIFIIILFLSLPVIATAQEQKTGESLYKEKRIDNSWILGLTYLVILIDAYVDAHLYRFDDSVILTYNYIPQERTFTLGVHFAF